MFTVNLTTPQGRLIAFTLLYVIEGIPEGFTGTFVPFYLSEAKLSNTDIGDFGWWDYWPWTVKWLWAPFVDIFFSKRQWLLTAQTAMVLTLFPVAFMYGHFASNLQALKASAVVHNIFSAVNDIAIDALAVGTLPVQEGASVNGMMFGAKTFGTMLGGSLALLISSFAGYFAGVIFVCVSVTCVFLLVTVRVHVDEVEPQEHGMLQRLRKYFQSLWNSLFGEGIWVAILFAIFPGGPILLDGPHVKSLMQSHGLDAAEVAQVVLISNLARVATTVLGGFVSNWVGPRRLVAFSWLSSMLVGCIVSFWSESALTWVSWLAIQTLYSGLMGLSVGCQMGLFMSVCDPEVAATQFTIFCCLCNNSTAWAKSFHGRWIDSYGYQRSLQWDTAIAVIPLLILPFLSSTKAHED